MGGVKAKSMRIIAEGLTYIYNEKSPFATSALQDVSLTIEGGEFFGIIGHTGSGKSTFVQHLNGLIPVSKGRLTVGDFNLKKYTKKEYKSIKTASEIDGLCFKEGKKLGYRAYLKRYLAEVKKLRESVGMVFQYPEYQLFGDTVFADVAFGLKNFHPDYDEGQIENKVRNAIERVGLNYNEVKDKSPFDLSGGQKRRVAIAGVIVTEPKILVLDEPVAGLDPQGKRELMQLLHSLHGQVCETVIIVSHDMDDVAENCTKVAVFSEGRLVCSQPPRELFKDGEMLSKIGLDVPVTARLTHALNCEGVELDSDFTIDGFAFAVAEKYKELKK